MGSRGGPGRPGEMTFYVALYEGRLATSIEPQPTAWAMRGAIETYLDGHRMKFYKSHFSIAKCEVTEERKYRR